MYVSFRGGKVVVGEWCSSLRKFIEATVCHTAYHVDEDTVDIAIWIENQYVGLASLKNGSAIYLPYRYPDEVKVSLVDKHVRVDILP